MLTFCANLYCFTLTLIKSVQTFLFPVSLPKHHQKTSTYRAPLGPSGWPACKCISAIEAYDWQQPQHTHDWKAPEMISHGSLLLQPSHAKEAVGLQADARSRAFHVKFRFQCWHQKWPLHVTTNGKLKVCHLWYDVHMHKKKPWISRYQSWKQI